MKSSMEQQLYLSIFNKVELDNSANMYFLCKILFLT